LYLSSRTMMAQAIRAILLASATAATYDEPCIGHFGQLPL
jgi:hypothetical protein